MSNPLDNISLELGMCMCSSSEDPCAWCEMHRDDFDFTLRMKSSKSKKPHKCQWCEWTGKECDTSKKSLHWYEFKSTDNKVKYQGWYGPECAHVVSEIVNDHDYNQDSGEATKIK